jgi:hypothetical protein
MRTPTGQKAGGDGTIINACHGIADLPCPRPIKQQPEHVALAAMLRAPRETTRAAWWSLYVSFRRERERGQRGPK